MIDKNASLVDISKLPGVSDLPMRVKGPFAQALKFEANGETVKANEALDKAILAESI